jgi:hypothetical protein
MRSPPGRVTDLDETRGLAGEGQGLSGEGVEAEMVATHGGEVVEAFARIAGIKRDVDIEVAAKDWQGARASGEVEQKFGDQHHLDGAVRAGDHPHRAAAPRALRNRPVRQLRAPPGGAVVAVPAFVRRSTRRRRDTEYRTAARRRRG